MCYKHPGPRCSPHARGKMEQAKAALTEKPDLDTMAAYKAAEDVWLSTPEGIAHLREQGNKDEAAKRKRDRDRAVAAAKKQGQKEDDHSASLTSTPVKLAETQAEAKKLASQTVRKQGIRLQWRDPDERGQWEEGGKPHAYIHRDDQHILREGVAWFSHSTTAVGEVVARAFREQGYTVEWDGSERRVRVRMESWVPMGNLAAQRDFVMAVAERPRSGFDYREAMLTNPAIDTTILNEIASSPHCEVSHFGVALNPSTPRETLTTLASSESRSVRRAVAGNPNTPREVLTTLISSDDEYIGRDIARNPNTSDEALTALATSQRAEVRTAVVEHPNAPPSVIAGLYGDPDDYVREMARDTRRDEVLGWMKEKGMDAADDVPDEWLAEIFG